MVTCIITIDGPSGVGKSTVGRKVAQALSVPFLESGGFYRAVTWVAWNRGIDRKSAEACAELVRSLDLKIAEHGVVVDDRQYVPMADLHSPGVTADVALLAAHPEVRDEINKMIRRYAGDACVVEGRDIGRTVFPDAPVKIWMDAPAGVRQARIAHSRGEEVAAETVERDRRDAERTASPALPADDAHEIDTSQIGEDGVVEAILSIVKLTIEPAHF